MVDAEPYPSIQNVTYHLGLQFSVRSLGSNRWLEVARASDGEVLDQAMLSPGFVPDDLPLAVDDWIACRLGAVPSETPVCTACGEALAPVHGLGSQPAGALEVSFTGGYGMFFDPVDGDRVEAVLCRECATELTDVFPWVAALLSR